jgi:Zn-dependent peptidase ImmA (M78 family)
MKNHEQLSPEDEDGVRRHAARLLAEAAAIGRFPTPIEDLLTAANVRSIEENVDQGYVARLYRQAVDRGTNFLRAIGKVLGLCHPDERVIIIDDAAHAASKPFIKLHETAHVYMPHQRQAFGMMMDCRHTLDPDVKQLFEYEANAFASEVLFQADAFTVEAEDHAFGLKVPMRLSKKYGGSVYASIRRYVVRNSRCCAVVVLDPPEPADDFGFRAALHRIVPSDLFKAQFDLSTWPQVFTPDDDIGRLVPLGTRRMSWPATFALTDRNGNRHDCIAEAFKTTWHVMVLILVTAPLTRRGIILPTSVTGTASNI